MNMSITVSGTGVHYFYLFEFHNGFFDSKEEVLRETKVQKKTSYSFRHKGNRYLLLHQVPV
jgi:hypothetical protein